MKDNGGPAFANQIKTYTSLAEGSDKIEYCHEVLGLTILDYFAAKAMQAIYTAAMQSRSIFNSIDEAKAWRTTTLPIIAYDIATAMLAEKRRREEEK